MSFTSFFSEFCISKIIKINTKILRTTEMDGDRFRVRELSMSKWFFCNIYFRQFGGDDVLTLFVCLLVTTITRIVMGVFNEILGNR